MGPQLTIDIRTKRFAGDPVEVFRDFALTVQPSSVVALVGPSGVGKSTLLRIIAGIDSRYEGAVRIGGDSAAKALAPGFVFQDARLLPWFTALRNITAASPGTSNEAALRLLAMVGLETSADAFPHELSGGMQRRLALARAVSVNRQLWLFDEPFVSLDRRIVGELQELFLDLASVHSPTVVFVTHVPEEAARLATRAVVLRGRPAVIVADLAFDTAPAQRSEGDQRQLSAQLTAYADGNA